MKPKALTKKLGLYMIGIYKRNLSPIIGRECIYTPTCSMYTADAIVRYGLFRGSIKGAGRILRCNPFHKGGFDPVKENYKGNAKWLI